jgi:hypothetical protein
LSPGERIIQYISARNEIKRWAGSREEEKMKNNNAVTVIGVGLMGPGIATCAALAGHPTGIKMGMGIRFPVWGPLEHIDAVGLDLALSVQNQVLQGLNNNPEPPSHLRELVNAGRLGYKSGSGFYDWEKKNMKNLADRRDRFIMEALRFLKANSERCKSCTVNSISLGSIHDLLNPRRNNPSGPNGFQRLMEVLERESPEFITLEMSEYGMSFRERHGSRLKERVFYILKDLREESTNRRMKEIENLQTPLERDEIRAILLTREIPLEFKAVSTYCARKLGVPGYAAANFTPAS